MKSPVIECNRLVAAIDDTRASTQALDFNVQAGSVVSIIGPDHSGKSDWLKTLAGIEPPVSGELCLLGKNTRNFNRDDWVDARTRIAYVHSDTALLSAANALQNVMLPAVYHDRGRGPELSIRALDLLQEITGNCDYDILPAYLRKDQSFRVAIARALILEPDALLLDKPFTHLDRSTSKQLQQYLLKRVKHDGLMLMLVTHDIKFALRHSNQIIFMSSDRIYQFDGANALSNSDIPEVSNFMESAL